MMKKIHYLALIAVLLLPFAPVARAAYNDVTTDGTANVVLPSDGRTYKIETNTVVEEFTVNSDNVKFTMPSGSVAQIVSADKIRMASATTPRAPISASSLSP